MIPDRAAAATRRTFAVTAAVTALATAAIAIRGLAYTRGELTYVIDDGGIHLSMAQQLARTGTWGVSAGVFEPVSSSPAWTLLLAALHRLAGGRVAAWWPLLANLVAAGWVCWLVARHQAVARVGARAWGAWVFALTAPLAAWFLPGLAATGMEHTLQAALWIVVLVHLDRVCGTDPAGAPAGAREVWLVAAALAVAAAVRYETLFLAGGCVIALWSFTAGTAGWRRVATRGTGWLAAAAAPVVVMGVINLGFGRSFLPNSILRKSGLAGETTVVPGPGELARRLGSDPLLAGLLLAATIWALWAWRRRDVPSGGYAAAIAVAGWAQLLLGDVGWYARYQAALVCAGTLLALRVLPSLVRPPHRQAALGALALVLVLGSLNRVDLLRRAPLAMSNTWRQQVQVGRFLGWAYRGEPVAVTDLGYPSLHHDGPIVDLEGLGTYEVLLARRRGDLDRRFLEGLLRRRGVQAMAIYDLPYLRMFPRGWAAVGTWDHGQANVTPRWERVAFFAPAGAPADRLDRALRAFAPRLPEGVVYRDRERILGDYLDALGRRRAAGGADRRDTVRPPGPTTG